MIVIRFLKNYGYVALLFVLAIVSFILIRRFSKNRDDDPMLKVKTEIDAIKEETEVRKLKEKEGTKIALKNVETKYHHEIAHLNEKQQKQKEKLKNDPVKLAKFLVRIGSSN